MLAFDIIDLMSQIDQEIQMDDPVSGADELSLNPVSEDLGAYSEVEDDGPGLEVDGVSREVMADDHGTRPGMEDISSDSGIDEGPVRVEGSFFDDAVDFITHDVPATIDDFYYTVVRGSGDVVTENHFSVDGTYDTKNNVIVVGDVANDLQYIGEQTSSSCSLMAQEQFVHRYIGREIPEDYLRWQAERWGVYSDDEGTDYWGQTRVLEHFNIPFDRDDGQDLDDLNKALTTGKDVIIGVSAREFYDSSEFPPGSDGHAVTVTGYGVDPQDPRHVTGYYVTDSNFPHAAHFVSVDKMERAWDGDMISVPVPGQMRA